MSTGLIARPGPALANSCPDWADEKAFLDASDACRQSFVLSPPRNELLSHQDILNAAPTYARLGIPKPVLERMVEDTRTFSVDDGLRWSGCDATPQHTFPCPDDQLHDSLLMDTFSGSTVTLSIFVDPQNPDVFIVRGCGNTPTKTDVEKRAFRTVDAPSRLEIGLPADVTVRSTLVNNGPLPSVEVEDIVTVEGPPDCTFSPSTHAVVRRLDIGVPVDVDVTVSVTCTRRSFHDFVFRDRLRLLEPALHDPILGNNERVAEWRAGVFEPVDLSVDLVRLRCGERGFGPATFPCAATATVTNRGPATAVATRTTLTLDAPGDCAITPAASHAESRRLQRGETAVVHAAWSVSCLGAQRHAFLATAEIAVDEPHAEDRAPGNDTGRRAWLPLDVKPRSDPSSINLGKQGVVPVAILSTPELDAVAVVDRPTVRFGATGFEDSRAGCGAPEDVNDDGLLDVVCRFHTGLTGLTCGATEATLTGFLRDGTPFEGQDTVKITGC